MNVKWFRMLLLVTAAVFIAWLTYPVFGFHESENIVKLRSAHGYGALISADAAGTAAWAVTIMQFAGLVGLWFSAPWGRWVLLLGLCGAVALAPFAGIAIQTASEVALGIMVTVLEGITLGAAFLGFPSSEKKDPDA